MTANRFPDRHLPAERPLPPGLRVAHFLAAVILLAATGAQAISSVGPTGRTNKSGVSGVGPGCAQAGCHTDQQDTATMTVVIDGPAFLAPGATGSYSVTSTKASLGNNVKMGVNIAASDPGAVLSESAANLVISNNEIVHSAAAGALNTTGANGQAQYNFSFTMPANASLGSAHTLYAVSRLGFSGGWRHAANFPVIAATLPGAPTGISATAGNTTASISFSAPATTGGAAIGQYSATCTSAGGNRSVSGTSSPLVVTSMTNGTTYSCSVTASSAVGTGAASSSVNVTPQAPGVAPQITSSSATSFTVGSAGTFTVSVSGTPTPTVTISGSLPSGVTFNSGTRVLSGTPAAGTGGTWPVTFTAANGTQPDATQNFTLTVARLNQTISFVAPPTQSFTLTPYNLTASATSGLAVTFASNTPAVCQASGTTVLFQSAGTCSIVASQFGNGSYNAAPTVTQSFAVTAVLPGTPSIVSTTPGNGQVILGFSAPTSNGGSTITSYTATCNPGGFNATGTISPLTVTGLANSTSYQCNVTASNAVGTGPASANVAVTPTTGPVAPIFTSAASKTFAQEVFDAVSIVASGTPNPTLTLSGTLPAGLAFRISSGTVPATGIISGTPLAGTGGVYPLTITASNGTLPNALQNFTLTVLPRNQTITTTSPPSPQFFAGGPVPLAASASSGLPVVYTSANPSVCAISGSSAVMQGPGSCFISVTQPGNSSYNPAPAASINFVFQASAQTLTFDPQTPSSRPFVSGGAFSLNPGAASSLGMPVSYSTNGFNCAISGTTVTMLNVGTCAITASQSGDARVLGAASITQNIDLLASVPGAPTITAATASNNSANFTVAPPANDGGSSIFNYTLTCTDGNFSQTQSSFSGNPVQFSLFSLNNGVAYTCTVKATNSIGDSAPSAPVVVTPGNTANGQTLYQSSCINCHFAFTPSGAMLNGAGDTGAVIAYARANNFTMGNDFGVQQLSASDLAAIAAYIKQQLPPITPSTTVDIPVNIDLSSHITLNTLSFNQIEIVNGPTNGTLTPNFGTNFTYTPSPGFAGTDSFTYRGVRNDFQPPLTGDARTIMITVAGPTYFLSVNNNAGGFFGNNSRVTGPGIDCGIDCSESYSAGTLVTLTPQAQAGYVFSGWSGDCSGTGACQLTMSGDRFVSANFTQAYMVTPGAGPNGSISPVTPVLLPPGGTTSVTITPDPGYIASVGGTCFGSLVGNVFTTGQVFNDCSVAVLFIPVPVTFNVVLEGAQENPLSLSPTVGSGTVQVNTTTKTITYNLSYGALQGVPDAVYFQGPAVRRNVGPVKYTAGSGAGYGSFTYNPADEADILAGRWYINIYSSLYPSGEIRGQIDSIGAAPLSLITVTKSPPFGGTVSADPAVLSCGLICSYNQPTGALITLTATPDPAYSFTGWSGGSCSGTGPCFVTGVFGASNIVANFSPLPVYSVTATGGANGTVSPDFLQAPQGGGMSFTITPDAGFRTVIGGTCTGTLSGNTYTITNIQANCSLSVTFPPLVMVPDAPTGLSATPGNGQASISFTPPANNGGAAITSYQATCNPGAFTGSATGSPILVTGLASNTAYTCSVTATNSAGTGAASAAVNATTLPALVLSKVVSRKLHGALGPFEVTIDTTKTITQLVSTEPRSIGAGHRIVFQFNNPVTTLGSVTAINGQGNALAGVTTSMSGNEVTVTLTAVPDNSRVTVQLNNVNGALSPAASLGFLLGDVMESRAVTAADIAATKSRLPVASATTTSSNFRLDVNASGSITTADVAIVKSQAGKRLP